MATTYRVEGMTCQGCVNALTNAIKAAAPQATVEIDLTGGKVTVDGLDDATVVAQAVTDAGFEFAGTL
jgi:copper chaperone